MNTVKENRSVEKTKNDKPSAWAPTGQTYLTPVVNIFETKDGYQLEAEMPGVNSKGLEVLLEGNELTILGHREFAATSGEPLYRESKPIGFRRVFELDPAIDTQKITARMENGVLFLTLPKAERVKPRKITVTA
jgi:HSP20 family protein